MEPPCCWSWPYPQPPYLALGSASFGAVLRRPSLLSHTNFQSTLMCPPCTTSLWASRAAAQWPGIALTGVLLCPPKGKSAANQNVQGRCQDGHIHSSAGVAVRGEKERDGIQESPVGLRTTSPWAQGRNGFLDGGTAWAKAQALTVQAGTQCESRPGQGRERPDCR